MATITVTSSGDVTNAGDGVLTLREALDLAVSGDTIVFDASLAGQTITLTQGALEIEAGVTVDGNITSAANRPDITINGNGGPIVDVDGGTISSLYLTGGGGGSGLAVVSINSGTMQYSEVFGNSVPSGGQPYVVLVTGSSTDPGQVLSSSIYNNSTAVFGGDIVGTTSGLFAIYDNVTIAGNTATGASSIAGLSAVAGGVVTLTNSTITGNSGSTSGGVRASSGGSVTVSNSIISGNSGAETSTSAGGSIVNAGGNVINGDDALIFASLTGGGGTIADNGGPVQTVALNANTATNPAIDIGAGEGGDARGVSAFDFTGVGGDGSNFDDAGSFELLCFAPGTQIAAPCGARAVETLRIGDPILTYDGRTVPVKFVFRQTIVSRFRPPEQRRLVHIAKGAFGNERPVQDLIVTADHALLLDGLLVNAGVLVGGHGVRWEPMPGRMTVYHVETDAHDIILAEGAPSETYIDYVARQAFDNYAEYVALYGEEQSISEMAIPRVTSTQALPFALKARLGLAEVA